MARSFFLCCLLTAPLYLCFKFLFVSPTRQGTSYTTLLFNISGLGVFTRVSFSRSVWCDLKTALTPMRSHNFHSKSIPPNNTVANYSHMCNSVVAEQETLSQAEHKLRPPIQPITNCVCHSTCRYLYAGMCTILLIADEGPRTETSDSMKSLIYAMTS